MPLLALKFNFLKVKSLSMNKFYQLDKYCAIKINGDRGREFLQGQASCDLNTDAKHWTGLFCDEKGFVLSNATIILDDNFYLVVRECVGETLVNELTKYAHFYKCTFEMTDIRVFAEVTNKTIRKSFEHSEDPSTNTSDWEKACMENFQYDIDCEIFGKFRPQELGYDLGKFISYEKGCYRGQEIIARVTYLGKKNKAAVIFANVKSPITDVAGKKIGKEVFSKNFENLTLHHYYIEKNDYFVEGEQISPYASQW